MNRFAAAAVALLPVAAGGCVAAAIPIVAGGMIARDQIDDRGAKKPARMQAARAAVVAPVPATGSTAGVAPAAGRLVMQPGLAQLPRPDGTIEPAAGGAAPRVSGGGEAAAYSLQAYQALWNHLAAQAAKRQRGEPLQSVVLGPGATLDAPRYADCGAKPLAAVFDIDESAEKAADPDARWRKWKGDGSDLVIATPGAVEGVDAARREGIAVIFSTYRPAESGAGVAALLDQLGFGRFEPGKTLILRGDARTVSGDEQVRQAIAAGYCVIALVGDSLEDFSTLFNAAGDAARRQTAATETMVAPLWGAGWFILPNPVRSIAPSQPKPTE